MENPERDVAVALLQQERRRQIGAEGYSPEHDDQHDEGQLAMAASCYAVGLDVVVDDGDRIEVWPWEGNVEDAIEGKSRLRQLIIAGALILAEIERRLRAGEQV